MTCLECGAIEGHREIVIEPPHEDGRSGHTSSSRACSLGQAAVPRAEYERVVAALKEANEKGGELQCALEESTRDEDRWKKMSTECAEVVDDLIKSAAHYLGMYEACLNNLTAAQARCTELFEEVRTLKGQVIVRSDA